MAACIKAVLLINPQYRYALVSEANFDDLWILSREPQLDKSITDNLTAKAKKWGFSTNKLAFVEQKALKP
jgi:apolipoprotein D and lipocalin family protein